MPKVTLSKEVEAKLESERLERNKIRIFDLMVRLCEMDLADVRGVQYPTFAAHPTAMEDESPSPKFKPGFWVNIRCFDNHDDISGVYARQVLRIDSEDWEFEGFDEYLDQLQWRAGEEKRKKDERDAELRKLSPKQRETLGFGSWSDPLGPY